MTAYFKGAKGSWIWLVLRLYVGYEWMMAGWEKLTGDTPFDATGTLTNSVTKLTAGAHPSVQPWWAWFLKNVALPNIGVFNFLVKYGEFLVGVALIVGFATLFAAAMGMVMNFAFLLSGYTSTNTQLLILELIIMAAGGAYAGYVGVDYWFRPYWRSLLDRYTRPSKSVA